MYEREMKLGIMQPYFFPYIGYFSLIKYVDRFILFDTPQYISHGWINRNRILNQNGEVRYITVPIQSGRQNIKIKDVKIDNVQKWNDYILGSLTVYKRKAPYYKQTLELVRKIFENRCSRIAELNYAALREVCSYLGIDTPINVYSEMGLSLDKTVKEPDEWALYITQRLGYQVYVNPPGGQHFFDRNKYKKENIRLEFLESTLPPYIQRIGYFVPGLSILDTLMFCNANEINKLLDEYNII